MMLLCADIGNSHTTIGLVEDQEVQAHWRLSTDERRTADEWFALLTGLIADAQVDGFDGIAVCSAVPNVLYEWRRMQAVHHVNLPTVVVEAGVRTGIKIRTDHPKEVGSDRIVNAVAAMRLYGGPAIVVDMGTATTFDVVNQHDEYLGGAIAPGIGISVDALRRRGAQLRQVELTKPRAVIGKNTIEAMQSGMLYGFASQIDGMVARIIVELGVATEAVSVIGTGGMAPGVIEECRSITAHEPWLTLLGLEMVFHRNQ